MTYFFLIEKMILSKFIEIKRLKNKIFTFFLLIMFFVIGQLGFGQNNLFTIYSPGSVNVQKDSIFLYKFEDEKCLSRRVTRIFSYDHLGDSGSPVDIFFDPDGALLYLDGNRGDVYELDTADGNLDYRFNFSISGDFLTGAVADYKGVFYTVGFFGGRIYSFDPNTGNRGVTEPLFPGHEIGYDMTFYKGNLCFTVRKVGELLHKFYCVDLSTLEPVLNFDLKIDSINLPLMFGISTKADSCGTEHISFCSGSAFPHLHPGPWKIYEYYPELDTLIGYCDSLYPQKIGGSVGAAHRYEYLASMPQVEIDSAAYELHFPNPCRRDSGLLSIVADGAIDSLLFAVDGEAFSRDSVRQIIGAGWHEIYVKDSRSCFALDSFYFDPPPPLQWESLDISPAQCETDSSGSMQATVSGLPPFQYALDGASFSGDSISEGLSPGIYDFRVRDSLGCVLDTMVEVPSLDGPDFSLGSQAEECERRNGRIWVLHAGNENSSYRLNGGSFQADSVFEGLAAGSYEVSILDSADCVYSDSVEIEREILEFTYFETDTSCAYSQVIQDTMRYAGAEGCDSLVITTRVPGEVIILRDTVYECGANASFLDSTYISDVNACDSLYITRHDPAPIHEKEVTKDSCSAEELPDEVEVLSNVYDCDSVIRTSYNVYSPDTVETVEEVCEQKAPDTLVYSNLQGCDSVVIQNYQLADLSVDLGPDLWIAAGDSVQLQPDLSGAYTSFRWIPEVSLDDANKLSPFTTPDQTIEYELEIVNALGCMATDNIVIQVEQPDDAEEEINFYIPNIFSPNGDGVNDVFRPELGEGNYALERLQIYDRWGNRLYECRGPDCAWRGQSGSRAGGEGVYVYEIQIRTPDGQLRIETGAVTLVR